MATIYGVLPLVRAALAVGPVDPLPREEITHVDPTSEPGPAQPDKSISPGIWIGGAALIAIIIWGSWLVARGRSTLPKL